MKKSSGQKSKPPVSYHGGKQQMSRHILPLIDYTSTTLYCEGCVGGGAIFWLKKPHPNEVINDINGNVVNFYQVLKNNALFEEFSTLLEATLHSRAMYHRAVAIYRDPGFYSKVERAWAFFVGCNQSFSSQINSNSWAYERKGNNSSCRRFVNKKNAILLNRDFYIQRLENVSIESRDVISLIKSRDFEGAFFYIDPPYPNTEQAHYRGYAMRDFIELMELLQNVKGKFLLSSYVYPELSEFTQANDWYQLTFKKASTVASPRKRKGSKIEVLTSNYPLGQVELF